MPMDAPARNPNDAAAAAAEWMRRGLALLELQTSDANTQALELFDAAIAARSASPQRDPLARYDLAGAWLNRGEALSRLQPSDRAGIVAAIDEAIALLSHPRFGPHPDSPPWRRRL